MQEIRLKKNQAGQRMDKFLGKYFPNATTSFLYKMLRKKNITLNGKKAEGREILCEEDVIQCFFSDETFAKFTGNDILTSIHNDLSLAGNENNSKNLKSSHIDVSEYEKAFRSISKIQVLYENKDIVVLNKPAGVLTQKANKEDLSLNEYLIGYLLKKGEIDQEELRTFKPSVCNRLDRNTSGIVLCGKSLAGSQYLSKIIKDRSIQKFYRTIVVGKISKGEKLSGYLTKNYGQNIVSVRAGKKNESEKDTNMVKNKENYIETSFEPLNVTKEFTELEVHLITGKTHQIRAHLASVEHPIIGDGKYGNDKVNQIIKKKYHLGYQLLHAYRIEFPKCQKCSIELPDCIIAPYPSYYERIKEALEL